MAPQLELLERHRPAGTVLKQLLKSIYRISNLHILLQLSHARDDHSHPVRQHPKETPPEEQDKEVEDKNQIASKDHAHGPLHCDRLCRLLDALLVRYKRK